MKSTAAYSLRAMISLEPGKRLHGLKVRCNLFDSIALTPFKVVMFEPVGLAILT